MLETDHEDIKINQIKTKIVDMVNTAWTSENLATLIAIVGSQLNKEFDLKKDLSGLKLAEFIEKELSDKLKFVDSPKDPKIKALIPVEAKLGDDISSHFVSYRTKKTTSVSEPQRININRSVWKAFSTGLVEKQFRHIQLEPKVYFIDKNDPNLSQGFFLIDSNLIDPKNCPDKNERDAKIQQNILDWVKNNSIDLDKVLLKKNENFVSTKLQKSVFTLLIESLDSNDYARLNMPLDIVVKLQNKTL